MVAPDTLFWGGYQVSQLDVVDNRGEGSSEPTTFNWLDVTGLGGSILIVTNSSAKIIIFMNSNTFCAEISIFVAAIETT